jgi:hypothetical protein
MTSIALRSPTRTRPSWLRLVTIQVGLIARSGRWIELIGGAAALYVLAVFGPMMGPVVPERLAPGRVWGQWALYCLPLIAVWPSLLWRGEPFGRRHYHWSLPVSHGAHDLARVMAGGLWVGVVVAMLVLGNYVSIWPLGMMTEQSMSEIMAYAVGLFTLYCVASVFTLVVAHPARWFFGVLTVYLLLWAPLSIPPVPRRVYRALGAPLVGRYGLFWATLGAGSSGDPQREVTDNTITTSPGDKVSVTLTTTDSTTKAPGHGAGEPKVEVIEFPGPHWKWGASVVWLLGSIGAMLLIAERRRER